MAEVLTAEHLWAIPRVGRAAVGGGRSVVSVTTYDLESNIGTTRLWEVYVDGRSPRALTASASSATKPVLSGDGKRLAFVREVNDRPQVHVMPMDGGEPEALTDLPLGVIGAKFMPDARRLAVVATVYRHRLGLAETREERDRLASRHASARVTEHAVYRVWDRWLTDGEVPHVFVVDGGDVRDVTPTSRRWMRWDNEADPLDDIDISPDGTRVAWCADRSEPPHRELRFALFVSDVGTGEERGLTPDHEGHVNHPRFTPDGSRVLYGKTHDPRFYADRVRLTEHDLVTGHERSLLDNWDRSPANWSFDGDDVVFEAEDEARQPIWRLSDDTGLTEVARDGTLSGLSPLGDGTLVATRSSIIRPPELVRLADGSAVTPLTDFTAPPMADIALPTVLDVRYDGADGGAVQMFVVTPPRLGDRPAPLVHLIHGGPHATFGDTWHWRWNAMTFVGADRRAALVNFHGSTSFGQAFAASIRGQWANLPATDIDAATESLIGRGLADADRIAIVGGSYGGYLVAWLVSQSSRYRCAVAHAAVTDLPGMYASDITSEPPDAHWADVWSDLDQIQRWSPAAHAAGYDTPTLVIHGERDYRVPVGQGLELYGVLKAKGVAARLVYYPDENHWVLSPANSIHWYREIDEWLNRYL